MKTIEISLKELLNETKPQTFENAEKVLSIGYTVKIAGRKTHEKVYNLLTDEETGELVLVDPNAPCEGGTHLHFKDIADFLGFVRSISGVEKELRG